MSERSSVTAEAAPGVIGAETAGGKAVARRPRVATPASVMSDAEITSLWRLAESLARSGDYKVEGAAQAFSRILVGRDLGLTPTRSLMTIDLVNGGISLRGVLLLAFVKQSEQYDYKLLEHTQERAEIEWYEKSKRTGEWEVTGTTDFDLERAAKLPSWKPNEPKAAWNTARENMLVWRTASNGVKFLCPDLFGGTPVYTEADDFPRQADVDLGAADVADVTGGLQWDGVSIEDQAKVERVLRRAQALGHTGWLSDRDSIIMNLSGQPPIAIDMWVEGANEVLDKERAAKPRGAHHTPIDREEGTFCVVCGEALPNVDKMHEPCPGPGDVQGTATDLPDPGGEAPAADAAGAALEDSVDETVAVVFDERRSALLDEREGAAEAGDEARLAEIDAELDALGAEHPGPEAS